MPPMPSPAALPARRPLSQLLQRSARGCAREARHACHCHPPLPCPLVERAHQFAPVTAQTRPPTHPQPVRPSPLNVRRHASPPHGPTRTAPPQSDDSSPGTLRRLHLSFAESLILGCAALSSPDESPLSDATRPSTDPCDGAPEILAFGCPAMPITIRSTARVTSDQGAALRLQLHHAFATLTRAQHPDAHASLSRRF